MEIKYNINLLKKLLVDEFPILKRYIRVNYGLLPDAEDHRDYIMGADDDKALWKVLNPDADWGGEAEQMIHETQKSFKLETMNCTRFALNNVKEMLHINKWNEVYNYSDRFPGSLQGTSRSGNSMKRQLDIDRKLGCVKEEEWPWDKNKFDWNDYYAVPPQNVLEKGKIWLKKYILKYDSVWATRSMIIEALKYSPLYVGLYAWYEKGGLYYSVASPNHASTIISRDKFLCYDSYDPHVKQLDDGFKIYFVKRIYLAEREREYNKKKILEFLARGAKRIMRVEKGGEIWEISEKGMAYKSKDQYTQDRAKQDFASGVMIPMNEKDWNNIILK